MPPPQAGQVQAPSSPARARSPGAADDPAAACASAWRARGSVAAVAASASALAISSASPASSSSSRSSSCSICRVDPLRGAAELHPPQLGDLELQLLDFQVRSWTAAAPPSLRPPPPIRSGRPARKPAARRDRRADRRWRATCPTLSNAILHRTKNEYRIAALSDQHGSRSAPAVLLCGANPSPRSAAPTAPASVSSRHRRSAATRICPAQAAWRTGTGRCRPSTGL